VGRGRVRWAVDALGIANAVDGVADAESGAWLSRVGGGCCERGLGVGYILTAVFCLSG
jgi:hypothetical protein